MNNNSNISPGPWEYVPGSEHHGPYICTVFGSTICDFYTMTEPREWSTAAGGPSKLVNFCGGDAEANARLAAEAWNMAEALRKIAGGSFEGAGNAFLAGTFTEKLQGIARDALVKALGTPQDAPKP